MKFLQRSSMIAGSSSKTGLLAFLLVAAMVAGCATSGTAILRSGQVLTSVDWDHLEVSTVHDVVTALHPTWIQAETDDDSVIVFLDGGQVGNASALRMVQIEEISEIRFEPAQEAVRSLGPGFSNGIIYLKSRP